MLSFFLSASVGVSSPNMVIADSNDLVVKSFYLSQGDIIVICFEEDNGFFVVAEPSSYFVKIAQYGQCDGLSDSLWYNTTTNGIFSMSDVKGVAFIIATRSGTFDVTVGYLSYSCCGTVDIGLRRVQSETVYSSSCHIAAYRGSLLKLKSRTLTSSFASIEGFWPKGKQVWTSEDDRPTSKLTAVRLVNKGTTPYEFISPSGEPLLALKGEYKVTYGRLSARCKMSNPFVQYDPWHIERLEYLGRGSFEEYL
jgi:hypothetical protein